MNFIYKFRTTCFAAFFILSALFLHAHLLHAQSANTPWPVFMHDIKHTGQSALSGPQKNTPSWKYQTGSGITAPPVLGADGTIYVGSLDGNLYAISPGGGKKWSYETGGGIYAAAAAVDANDVIYAGSDDGYLYAIQKDGTLKWRYKASGSINSAPVVGLSNGAIYFGSEDKNVYAISPAGNILWKTELDEEVWSSPALDINNISNSADDVLYVGTLGGMFYAINAADGTKKWTYDTKDIVVGSPAIDDANGVILFGTGNGKIYALDKNPSSTNNVQPKWTYLDEDNQEDNMIISSPSVSANAIYVGSQNGFLYALNRTSGTLKWKYNAGSAITSSAAIDADGNVYFGSGNNNIYSIDTSGTQRWTYSTQDEVNSSPAIGNNELLYIGSSDGNLYAIGSTTTATVTADFTATPTTGEIPLNVKFTDLSVSNPANMIASWQWDFGDGSTSASQNPSHTYDSGGTFTVSLTVTSPDGQTATETKENYITVSRKSSTIEVTISDPEITFGKSVTITGSISPAHQAQVTLTFTKGEGKTETETVTSDVNGAFTLSNYFPKNGGSWSVTAGWEGDSDHSDAESSPLTVTVSQAEIALTIESSSSSIQTDQTVDISGIVTLTPDNETTRNEFLKENLKLISTNPDGEYGDVIETQSFLSGNQLQYKFDAVKLPDIGTWKILAGFEEDASFKGTNTAAIEIEVREVAKEVSGYAILVEGGVEGDNGKDSYNFTTNFIYNKLLERGFTEDAIYYFNFETSQDGVDAKPTKKGILNAIKTWAGKKMNTVAAPLYIIFTGPGDKEKLFIYPDTVKASDMADALNSLESQLNSSASEEPKVIVFGANRSGSFINTLSKSGSKRVIITSADAEEVAYKGPLSPSETTRHADYLVWEFFKYAARGLSLKKCYEKAASETAQFTENEDGNGLKGASAGNGQYFDNSAQHPLLDDNGDSIGSYGALSSLSGKDGEISADIVLGVGTTTAALELTEVTDILTLEAGDTSPTLFAKINDTSKADDAWVEITSPNHALKNDTEATEQQVISLPRFGYNDFDSTGRKYIWNNFSNKKFDNFQTPGEYRVFYFAQNTETGEITPFTESDVFINAAGNTPPSSFNTVSPANGTETAVALTFDWEESTDPDSKTTLHSNDQYAKSISKDDGVTYTLLVSKSESFDTIDYQQKGLTDSTAIVDKTAGLSDGTNYYWKVLASDSKGGTTLTGTSSSFKPKLSNGYPGFVKGYIFDSATNAKISNATISVQGTKGSYTTTTSGAYFLQLSSGTYTLSVDAPGYEAGNQSVNINALNTTTQNIGLTVNTQPAGIFGKVKDQKKNKPLEGVTITIKKKTFTETITTDSAGSYSCTDLESGKYTLTAKKSGYKGYKKNIKLETGQDKKLNIKLNKSSTKKK